MTALALTHPSGQDSEQVGDLGLAFLLSALIGLERELRQKSAGLRTLTIVGFAAALFMLISKYGFFDVAGPGVSIDPSRWRRRSSRAWASSAAGWCSSAATPSAG